MTDTNDSGRQANRRELLKTATFAAATLGAGAAAISSAASAQTAPPPPPPRAVLGGGADGQIFWTAQTSSGQVQGIANAGIKVFKGIPYGAPTGGANRFMPPKKPTPWTGVRECFNYGQICPQTPADLRGDYGMMIQWDQQPGGMGEDCLVLNVWTPGVRDGAKRAVLVSFHGGGFATGSGNAPGFDGAQLARFGDVVVVTVNHRLAAYGYTHLAGLGAPERFKYAGVCGVMDLVASLEWVRDNIEGFGGDPGRVMIFGQSGGGAKTSTVLAMPKAKGLFHRAAVQSGSAVRLQEPANGTKAAAALLDKLGISKTNVADIQKVSWQQLLVAQTGMGPAVGGSFSPTIGTDALPNHPFDPAGPEVSRDVPVIVSTTLEDAALGLTNFDLTEAGLAALLNQRFPGHGDQILAMYRRRYPLKSPFLVQAQAFTDSGFRRQAFLQAERKAAQGGAPCYMYQWDWATQAYDGRFGAVHGIDVSATFHSYRDSFFNGEKAGRQMADRLGAAWVAFAKTGDPNNAHIPNWEPFDAKGRATMVFDDDTHLEHDPRPEIRAFWAGLPPPSGPMG